MRMTGRYWFWSRFGAVFVRMPEAAAGPQQFDPSTSIHSSLEGLQTVDVTFRRTVAPDLFHCVLYRGPVFLQLPDESHDHFDPACLRFRGPASQTGHAATAQDAAKAQHEVTHRRKNPDNRFRIATISLCLSSNSGFGLLSSATAVRGEICRTTPG